MGFLKVLDDNIKAILIPFYSLSASTCNHLIILKIKKYMKMKKGKNFS
jgi:hypothetical protein